MIIVASNAKLPINIGPKNAIQRCTTTTSIDHIPHRVSTATGDKPRLQGGRGAQRSVKSYVVFGSCGVGECAYFPPTREMYGRVEFLCAAAVHVSRRTA